MGTVKAASNHNQRPRRIHLQANDISDLLFATHRVDSSERPNDYSIRNAISSSISQEDLHDLIVLGPIQVQQSSTTLASRGYGRGLFVTRDVAVGELLLVTPTLCTAPVDMVMKQWHVDQVKTNSIRCSSSNNNSNKNGDDTDSNKTHTRSLHDICEDALAHEMMQAVHQREHAVINAFLALEGAPLPIQHSAIASPCCLDMTTLNGQNGAPVPESVYQSIEMSHVRQIIRRNAFAADFPTLDAIATTWQRKALESLDTSSTGSRPSRLLGLYPLAAMINHSCLPNAVKVFAVIHNQGKTQSENKSIDVMMVHACQPIPVGHEVVWSYTAVTQQLHDRQAQLQPHGFICACRRCQFEQQYQSAIPTSLTAVDISGLTSPADMSDYYQHLVDQLECQVFQPTTRSTSSNDAQPISNETKRYMRTSLLQKVYVPYLNSIAQIEVTSSDNNKHSNNDHNCNNVMDAEQLLTLCTQLHFSLCATHNGSTEHLSILHLCYDLIAMIHRVQSAANNNNSNSKTLSKLRFWTDQLKRAHVARYGIVGNNVEHMRTLMKHTKQVLRQKDGLYQSQYTFI